MKVHYNSKPISSAVTTSVTTIFFTSKWHSPGHPRKQERQPGYPVTWDFSVSDEEGRCTGRLEFLFLPNLFLNKEERQVERLGAVAQRAEDVQQRNPSWENRRLGPPPALPVLTACYIALVRCEHFLSERDLLSILTQHCTEESILGNNYIVIC